MITVRTAERLKRAAYDYHDLAARLRAEGYDSEGNSMTDVARVLNRVGDSLAEKLEAKR